MFNKVFKRNWVSPALTVSFAAVGITGVLMLLHVRSMSIKELHEWMGIVMVAAGAVHLILNWRAFLGYLRSRSGLAALVVVAVASILLYVSGIGKVSERHGPPPEHRTETTTPVEHAEAQP